MLRKKIFFVLLNNKKADQVSWRTASLKEICWHPFSITFIQTIKHWLWKHKFHIRWRSLCKTPTILLQCDRGKLNKMSSMVCNKNAENSLKANSAKMHTFGSLSLSKNIQNYKAKWISRTTSYASLPPPNREEILTLWEDLFLPYVTDYACPVWCRASHASVNTKIPWPCAHVLTDSCPIITECLKPNKTLTLC